jgi:hypothetical protein
MRASRTPPYKRPAPDCIEVDDWRQQNGDQLSDGMLLKSWDQSTDIAVSRTISVDIAKFAASGLLPKGSKVKLFCTWWSSRTGLRGSGPARLIVVDPADRKKEEFVLPLKVPGSKLSGIVQIRTVATLDLLADQDSASALSPKRQGAILWEDSIEIVLEGSGSKFPISVVDFVETGIGPERSCWLFDWSPSDISLPAMATMRVYVNSRHAVFHAACTATEPIESQRLLRETMRYGLTCEMVRHAVDRAEDLEAAAQDLPSDSAGRVLWDLLERVFPGRSPLSCRELLLQEPGKFHAEVQAAVSLFSAK